MKIDFYMAYTNGNGLSLISLEQINHCNVPILLFINFSTFLRTNHESVANLGPFSLLRKLPIFSRDIMLKNELAKEKNYLMICIYGLM